MGAGRAPARRASSAEVSQVRSSVRGCRGAAGAHLLPKALRRRLHPHQAALLPLLRRRHLPPERPALPPSQQQQQQRRAPEQRWQRDPHGEAAVPGLALALGQRRPSRPHPLRPARPAKGTRPRGERAKTWAGFRAGQPVNRFAAVRARSARFGSRKSCSPLPALGGLYVIRFIGFSVRTRRFGSLCNFSAPLGTVLARRIKTARRRVPKVPDSSAFPGAKRLCGKKKQ